MKEVRTILKWNESMNAYQVYYTDEQGKEWVALDVKTKKPVIAVQR